jgi:hypothetical protein
VSTRATVEITRACSNRCVFCAAPDRDGDADWRSKLSTARGKADEVTFVGGEPTATDELEDAVREAAAQGFSAIGIQTNASGLDADRLKALAQLGLTDLHLSIHAATAAAHDYLVGEEGRFERCGAALEAAAALGLTTVVTTVITRSNFRVLGELPTWLRQRGVAAWVCQWPHVAGRAAADFDRVIPRLGLAVPYALHALERARRIGLPSAMRGAPLCALGSFAHHRLDESSRVHPDPCSSCEARPSCPGVDEAYVARFTAAELHARSFVEASSDLSPATARMFVGVGPLAAVPVQNHDAPAHARRRLPVLGRPAPATDETRRKSDLRPAGDAQDLFPKLFENDE